MTDRPDPKEQALQLLLALWRGIPATYKSRYRKSIWQQFEDDVRAAAYTNSLSRFYQKIVGRLGITLSQPDMKIIQEILDSGQDGAILKVLRDEISLLILKARLENQRRREEWMQLQMQEEEIFRVSDQEFFQEDGQDEGNHS